MNELDTRAAWVGAIWQNTCANLGYVLAHILAIAEKSLVCMRYNEGVSVVKTKKTSDTGFAALCFNGLVLLFST